MKEKFLTKMKEAFGLQPTFCFFAFSLAVTRKDALKELGGGIVQFSFSLHFLLKNLSRFIYFSQANSFL